jgi:hypothetical protein
LFSHPVFAPWLRRFSVGSAHPVVGTAAMGTFEVKIDKVRNNLSIALNGTILASKRGDLSKNWTIPRSAEQI